MVAHVSWKQALAWRMRRQLLDPIGSVSAPDVVRRLCAVQAQVASFAELAAAKPSSAVRLLGGFDQWVLGPGTADGHVVPAARRWQVSRQSGWISPVVVAGGVVAGTWELDRGEVRIAWFGEAGKPPRRRLALEVERLSSILDLDLRATIRMADHGGAA